MNQIIFRGQCIDNDDPMRLGRIRAVLKTENVADRESAMLTNDERIYKDWDERDPFVYKPLLPYFIGQVPKKNEYVHLFYSIPENKGLKDRFYIGGVFSSPTVVNNEPYDSAKSNLEIGSRNKRFPNILNENGELFNKKNEGVYPNPEDFALIGRGTTDIIIKDGSVLLRAAKNKPFKRGEIPEGNINRAFLQISDFTSQTVIGEPKKYIKPIVRDTYIQKLIEYNIINPENTSNAFTGDIYIYNLKPTEKVNTKNFVVSSNENITKSLTTTISFFSENITTVSNIINDTLKGIIGGDIGNIQTKYSVSVNGVKTFDVGLVTPLYFRPQISLYNKISSNQSTDINIQKNIIVLMNNVKYSTSDKTKGFGLVYDLKGNTSVPTDTEIIEISQQKKNLNPNTTNIMGADYLYLLSHKTQKQDAGKIDLTDTLYGISEEKITSEILPKTSSMVRGEELLELINLIIRYLVSHVHPFHGLSPNPQGLDGIRVDDLLKELLNANQKILNKYIRLN